MLVIVVFIVVITMLTICCFIITVFAMTGKLGTILATTIITASSIDGATTATILASMIMLVHAA